MNIIQGFKKYGFKDTVSYAYNYVHRYVVYALMQNSFSQEGEDLIIDKLLGYKGDGFYIDVGAYHPRYLSNTYRFYKKGWKGINIEPNPEAFVHFKAERARDINLNLGISQNEGAMLYYIFDSEMLNTLSAEQSKYYQANGHKLKGTSTVNTKPLSSIIQAHIPQDTIIDFLCVDAEGYDFVVLSSMDWTRSKPKVICVELEKEDHGGDNTQIVDLLTSKGYKIHHQGNVNAIFSL